MTPEESAVIAAAVAYEEALDREEAAQPKGPFAPQVVYPALLTATADAHDALLTAVRALEP